MKLEENTDIFTGKAIMMIVGIGSFGRKCTEFLLERFELRKLVIYSRDELKKFEMQQEFITSIMRYFIGDVRDRERLTMAMRGIDYVVHAAALKQVPAAEYNPMEFIKTNINGAENLIFGIRPGEKLHEVMCPSDDSHLTLEYSDHYVIKPGIRFFSRNNGFQKNRLDGSGTPVPENFEYSSGDNLPF